MGFVARVMLIGIAICSAMVAATKPADILSMVAWAFSLACGGQFPALALGIWWKGTTPLGAIAGMITGFTITLYYLIQTRYHGMELWWEVSNTASAIFGLPAGFAVTIIISLIEHSCDLGPCSSCRDQLGPCPKSDPSVIEYLDTLREPEMMTDEEKEIEQETVELGEAAGSEKSTEDDTKRF